MLRIPVQSRVGNFALAALGVLYSLGGLAVLAWFVVDVHNAAVTLDRLMGLGLIGSALCGVWFVLNALANLGVLHARRGLPQFHRPPSGAS